MKIGDVKLSTLSFKEYKGKLSGIILGVTGAKDMDNLLAILTAQYGQGQDEGYNIRTWRGKLVTMLSQSGGTGQFPFALYIISSNELDAQRNAESKQAAKKAAGDL